MVVVAVYHPKKSQDDSTIPDAKCGSIQVDLVFHRVLRVLASERFSAIGLELQCGAPKIAKMPYKLLNYDL
jgi:hypothetical protein